MKNSTLIAGLVAIFFTPTCRATEIESVSGACVKLAVRTLDYQSECKPNFLRTHHPDGRDGFIFSTGKVTVSFSGFRNTSIDDGWITKMQIDRVVHMKDSQPTPLQGVGVCSFGRKKVGEAYPVKCQVDTQEGHFSATFIADAENLVVKPERLISATTNPTDTQEQPRWRWSSRRREVLYGVPETDALVRIKCIGNGKYNFQTGSPSDKMNSYKNKILKLFADGKEEAVPYTVVNGDGDELIFPVTGSSLSLSRLVENGDFGIKTPSGERITIDGSEAAVHVRKLKLACGNNDKTSSVAKLDQRQDNNSGWWVVLSTGSDSPHRHENGGDWVDRIARKCGIRTFNDFSAKFVGFKPGYNVFVLLGSPYGSKQLADKNRELVKQCFPGSYVKFGQYLGE
ncbi:hypothetical protein [Methylobacterium sp. CM6247]